MPLLDIATVQPSLQNHLVPVRAQTSIHGQVFSSPWKSSQFSGRVEFHPIHLEKQGSCKLRIRAAALPTLELKSLVQKEDGSRNSKLAVDSSLLSTQTGSLKEDWVDLDERERLRRMRISKAIKGNTPWNKGRKHSAETRNRIRGRTRIVMRNPKAETLKRLSLHHFSWLGLLWSQFFVTSPNIFEAFYLFFFYSNFHFHNHLSWLGLLCHNFLLPPQTFLKPFTFVFFNSNFHFHNGLSFIDESCSHSMCIYKMSIPVQLLVHVVDKSFYVWNSFNLSKYAIFVLT